MLCHDYPFNHVLTVSLLGAQQSQIIGHNSIVSGWKSCPLSGCTGLRREGGKPCHRGSEEEGWPEENPGWQRWRWPYLPPFRQYPSSNLPSISLSQSRDFSQVIFQKREKMAAILASLLAIASLAAAKPQVFFVTIFSA